MASECCKILEPGTKGSNTPSWLCLNRNTRVTNTGELSKKAMKLAKEAHVCTHVWVIHPDGKVIYYKTMKQCARYEHVDPLTIPKYIDKEWKMKNKRGLQFRSKNPKG